MQADAALVHAILAEYSALTRTRMGRYLPDKEPKRYLYDPASDYPSRGGRGLRPAICIANARAFGSSEQAAIRSAVAIELMHNAMLVHDDIEDESKFRRGKPTLNEMYGVPLAINVGDTLMALSLQPLIDNIEVLGPELAFRILQETNRMARESAEGQATELGWRIDNLTDLTESDYHQMVSQKTSWLTMIHPLRVGALIGSGGRARLDGFIRLGFFLGSAFQIQDDILNLVGDEAEYGKEMSGDIEEGKRTLMLIRLFNEVDAAERKQLKEVMAMDRNQRACHAGWVLKLMHRHDCVEYAREVAHAYAGAAYHEFVEIYRDVPESRDKAFLRNLTAWVIERN